MADGWVDVVLMVVKTSVIGLLVLVLIGVYSILKEQWDINIEIGRKKEKERKQDRCVTTV